MTKLSENIIGKIKCDHIAPVPKWHFLLRGYSFWILFALSVFLGSLSFGVIVHIIDFGDFAVLHHLQGNLITSAVMLLPYFWLLSLLIFAGVAYANWKCTKLGYRFKRRWIVLGSVVLSMFFGSVFYAMGMAKKVDNMMTKSLPIYNQSKNDARRELWFQPENGLLTGKIIAVDEEKEKLIVLDEAGKKWSVADEGANWENVDLEIKGKIVKVIGEREGDDNFRAKEIRRCRNCQEDEDDEDDYKKDRDEKENQNENRESLAEKSDDDDEGDRDKK